MFNLTKYNNNGEYEDKDKEKIRHFVGVDSEEELIAEAQQEGEDIVDKDIKTQSRISYKYYAKQYNDTEKYFRKQEKKINIEKKKDNDKDKDKDLNSECNRITGNHKCDIQSDTKILCGQVKKDNSAITTMSGSDIAKSGFKAEEIFRTNPNIINSLEKYFKKPIKEIIKAPHGEKYDNIIIFEDKSKYNIQNKKILNLGGRGDSFDRRHIKKTFNNQFIRKYLTLLTLIRQTKRSTYMTEAQKKDFELLCNNNLQDIKQYIKKTLVGEKNKNDYWCIMKTDKKFSTINLYIIKTETFYNFIEKSISISIRPRNNGTCLHLSKYISLQRKGGGNTDNAPNDIQAKLKITKCLLDICDQIL